jgi:rubredoxin
MWLLFHRNAKTRPVRGGDSFVETCPECGKRATFVEVEVTESFGVFFVDLIGDKERAYRCSACGETFDLKDQRPAGAPPKPAPPAKSAAELARERELAEQQHREKTRAKAVQIEDELAELKKRMGR